MILSIESSGKKSSVCISEKNKILSFNQEKDSLNSSAILTSLIKESCNYANTSLNELNAIAVNIGPGSYTGLRVGLTVAKALCFTLNKPLITINGLYTMVYNIINSNENEILSIDKKFYFPIIKSRVGEFFISIYDKDLNAIMSPISAKTDSYLFYDYLDSKIIFIGDKALQEHCIKHHNVIFKEFYIRADSMVELAYKKFLNTDFSSVEDITPLYGKDVFITKY